MNLVIVESPAKCKKIQEYLGKDYIVKSSYGHFRDLQKKNLGINIENNYEPEYIVLDDKKNVVKELQHQYKKCTNLILAADQDREGEAIAWHLNEVLNKGKNTSQRIVFNEITKSALQTAIKNPGKININMFYAQQGRRLIDRLVGFLISPMLWKNIQSSYKKGQGLSAGRVQSVVNKLIIERENNITNFERKSYYNLNGIVEYNSNNIPIKYSKCKELDHFDKIKPIFDLTKTEKFIVDNIKNKKKKENAKPPFITSTLQQEAHNKLNMSSKQTMLIAQKLYENGLITYMRTDSINICKEALNEIKDEIVKLYGEKYYKKNVFKSKTKNAQEAHECCRVTYITKRTLEERFSSDEKRLYDLIWKKTISSQMSEMIKDVLDVTLNLKKYIFTSNYEKVDFEGYMIVYNIKTESKNDSLLTLNKASNLDFVDFSAEQKFTTPETRYNDSSLVKKLEELGIGRPSTFCNMVNSVVDKGYAVIKDNKGIEIEITNHYLHKENYSSKIEKIKYGNDKNKITPTQIGIIVNDYLNKYFNQIINYDFTALMENELDKISSGESNWISIVSDCHNKIKISIQNSPKKIIKDDYNNILGLNPTNKYYISVYIGQYGPVIKEYSDDNSIKPRYVSIKDIDIKTITLEEACELLKYPLIIGKHKEKEIYIDKGRFGLYVKYNNNNYSCENLDETDIKLDEIIEIIEKKNESKTGVIKKINAKVVVCNGKYGPYIIYNNKTNYKIHFNKDFNDEEKQTYIENLTIKDCNLIIENHKSKMKKKK